MKPPLLFGVSIAIGFAIVAVGFRLDYDDVIPEAAALVASGAALAFLQPRRAWLSLAGLVIGLQLDALHPALPPAAHVARYGPPAAWSLTDALKVAMFPAAGSLLGALAAWLSGADPTPRDDGRSTRATDARSRR